MNEQGSKPFVKDDNEMLWLGLLARDTGTPASQHLQIRDEVVALEFDRAVTLRLLHYDNEKEERNKRWWARFIGGADAVPDEVDDPYGVLKNDPYADENTQVM